MKYRIGLIQKNAGLWKASARHPIARHSGRKLAVRTSGADLICQPVEVRVIGIPTAKAARAPQFFAADADLSAPEPVLRILEAPPAPPRATRRLHEPIDWRICGDCDPRPEQEATHD